MKDPNRGEGDDYEVVRLSISWGALSILAFLLLMALQLGGARLLDLRLVEAVFATLALAAAGFVFGLVGMRVGRSRGAARLGVFFNGAVLFSVFVLVPLISLVLRRLG